MAECCSAPTALIEELLVDDKINLKVTAITYRRHNIATFTFFEFRSELVVAV